jgi:hypothetical protein
VPTPQAKLLIDHDPGRGHAGQTQLLPNSCVTGCHLHVTGNKGSLSRRSDGIVSFI